MMNCLQAPDTLPRVAFVSTGGTIAGQMIQEAGHCGWRYESAQHSGESLILGISGLICRAKWHFEQPYNIGSQNLELGHLLQLRNLILRLLQSPDIDGIIVTHGTDTMEDTLYFLYLTLPAACLIKPLLFTGAMLPCGHEQADGPGNICGTFQFLINELDQHSKEFPFGLVMQEFFTPAVYVEKNCTEGLTAFNGPYTVLANAQWRSNAKVPNSLGSTGVQGQFSRLFDAPATSHTAFESMEVPVVFFTLGNGPLRQLNDLLIRKPASLVFAAPGHGNIPDACVQILRRLLLNGVSVVRASRVATGRVKQGGEFHALDEFRQQPVEYETGIFSESGDLSLSKCVMYERLRILARSPCFRDY